MSAFVTSFSRRKLLMGGAGALVAAPFVAKGVARAEGEPKPFRIAWNTGAVCSAPVGYAIEKGIFAKHGLAAETLTFAGSTEQLLEAIATGKADAGFGMALRWLKPLEQGFDVRVTAGIHGGCMRLLGAKAANVDSLKALRGKTIAVTDHVSPSKNFFSIVLLKRGIDPVTEVEWRQYPAEVLPLAVDKGEAHAVADGDPRMWNWLKDGKFVEIANNLSGEYAVRTCCLRPSAAAWSGTSAPSPPPSPARCWRPRIGSPTSRRTPPRRFASYGAKGTVEDLAAMLRSHAHEVHPVGTDLTEQLAQYVDELKLVNVIKPTTDPVKFSERMLRRRSALTFPHVSPRPR